MAEDAAKRLKELASHLNGVWESYFAGLGLKSYQPPMKAVGAQFFKITPDEFSLYAKQNVDAFKDNQVVFMPIRKGASTLLLTRPLFRKYAQLLCDVADAFDLYEFNNPLRDAEGTRRMDFMHELAEHLHAKGCKQKKEPQLLKDYTAVLGNAAQQPPEVLHVAKVITQLLNSKKLS